ncbi:MAG: hypothetical protein KJ601_02820 [Nanoarchaeota archaeon]|nr:hypothetical protein [Nanoarchaeota archaeon]MBU1703753.1 hypothetical protein [Nanoarchaeota archaeon]
MEHYDGLRDVAKKKLQIADHMLTMTYPFVKDPKILLAVMDNVFLAMVNGVASILSYERTYKRIPPFQDTFVSKFNMFKQKCAPKYNIDRSYLDTIQEIKELIHEHKKSPMEFSRKDSFVICTNDYDLKTITLDTLKEYISKAKSFIDITSRIVENE